MIDSAPLIILRRASGVYLPGTYFPFSFALFPNSGFPFSSFRSVSSGNVLSLFFCAVSELRFSIFPAKYEHFGSADCGLVGQDARRKVHLVVQSAVKLGGCGLICTIAVNDVPGNNARTPKGKPNGGNACGKLLFLLKPPNLVIHLFWCSVEQAIAL